MKQESKKIFGMLLILVIIIGIIMVALKGFAFDLSYQDAKRVEFAINKEFEISDIKQITDEVFQNEEVIIQKVEVFEDAVSILTKEITDEQKQQLIDKVNEKYGTEFTQEEIEVISVDHVRGRDFIKPYILPFVIATILVLVYMAIRYYSLGIGKVLGNTIFIVVVSQLVLISVVAIARIPVGRLTIPMVLVVYLASLFGCTSYFEKKLEDKVKKSE